MNRDEAIAYGKEQLEIFGGQHQEFIRIAIEALERPHGEWIVVSDNIGDFQKAGYRWIKCNKCTNQVKIRLDSPLYDFCPYCGARMGDGND